MFNKLFCNVSNWRQALIQFMKVFTTPDETDPCKASINTNITGGSVDVNLPDPFVVTIDDSQIPLGVNLISPTTLTVQLDASQIPLTVNHACETAVQTGSFSDVSIGGTIPSGKRRVMIQNIGDGVGTIEYLGGNVTLFAGGEFEASQIIEACGVTTIIKTSEIIYNATGTVFRITVID